MTPRRLLVAMMLCVFALACDDTPNEPAGNMGSADMGSSDSAAPDTSMTPTDMGAMDSGAGRQDADATSGEDSGSSDATMSDVDDAAADLGPRQEFPTPMRRNFHAMAYDTQRERVVLFGGNGSIRFGDTWEWNGDHWTLAADADWNGVMAPSPRSSHGLAYDSARGRTVLFGGWDGNANLGDTWEWDGTAWAKALDADANGESAPSPRDFFGLAYDAERGHAVLFGGFDGVRRGDTWTWDGSTWTKVVSEDPMGISSPNPRVTRTMSYDSQRKKVVLFGGYDGTRRGDTWEWDGSGWAKVLGEDSSGATAPLPGDNHDMTYDESRGAVVLVDSVFGDLWEWNGTLWEKRTVERNPGARSRHAVAYDSVQEEVVLVGGFVNTPQNFHRGDTWTWDGALWSKRAVDDSSDLDAPLPRLFPALSDGPAGGLLLFGGSELSVNCFGDTWNWTSSGWEEVDRGDPPGHYAPVARTTHMAYDVQRDRVVLFGGSDGLADKGDTWEWDGLVWSRVAREDPSGMSAPPPGSGRLMYYNDQTGQIVLFGSVDGSNLGDTWTWDGSAWSASASANLTSPDAPIDRVGSAFAYDSQRDRVVLYGGFSGSDPQGDLWEWDGAVWSKVHDGDLNGVDAPPTRFLTAIAYDPQRGRLVLFGGTPAAGAGRLGDTWEWDGTVWTKVADEDPDGILAPGPRRQLTMRHHAQNGIFLFGGEGPFVLGTGSPWYSDSWHWDGTNWTRR